jgi:hypothetical protein
MNHRAHRMSPKQTRYVILQPEIARQDPLIRVGINIHGQELELSDC